MSRSPESHRLRGCLSVRSAISVGLPGTGQTRFVAETHAEVLDEVQPGFRAAFQTLQDRSTVRRDLAALGLVKAPARPVQERQIVSSVKVGGTDVHATMFIRLGSEHKKRTPGICLGFFSEAPVGVEPKMTDLQSL